MIFVALLLAMLGSIDSLLTSLVADDITRSHKIPHAVLAGILIKVGFDIIDR